MRPGRLENKRIIITGAAGGIGSALARLAAAEGAKLALVDVSADVLELAAELGGLAFIVDVTAAEVPLAVVGDVVREWGGVDGLANIAGGSAAGDSDVLGITDEQWSAVIDLNLTATFRWVRAAIPAMIASGGGSIVNTSSIAGTHSLPQSAPYVTSKAAIIGLTRSIAIDFGRAGVRCNSIAPGTIETPGLLDYYERNPGVKDGLLALNFRGRFGQPADVAALFVYLLSAESGFVNGENIAIDGGRAAGSVAAGSA